MVGLFLLFLFNLIFVSDNPCNAQMSAEELKEIFSGSGLVSEETGSDKREIVLPRFNPGEPSLSVKKMMDALYKRRVPKKPEHTVLTGKHRRDTVILKFAEGSNVRLRDGKLVSLDHEYGKNNKTDFDTLKDILREYVLKPGKGFPQPEAELDNSRKNALKKGIELADMNLYYDFRIDPDAADAEELINRLNLLDIVEIAYAPRKSAPFADIPPVTPDFSWRQGYLDSSVLGGIGARSVWPLTRGSGVRVRQIEWNWIAGHEDLNQNSVSGVLCLNQPSYAHHGTAVAGIISGLNNGYGITGIASEADFGRVSFCTSCTFHTSPIPGLIPDYYSCETDSFANVLPRTLQQSIPGDIINVSAGYDSVPFEAESGAYDAVRQAVLSDRIVVLAAGNSGINLDGVQNNIFNRGYRDSGAIFVGAGTPDTNHRRVVDEPTSNGLLWSSNYGNRLDLQGWGKSVTTTGGSLTTTNTFDGDLFNGGGDINQYYTSVFDGTSAAAPIVSGAAALVQSFFRSRYNNYLRPMTMRALLRNTGTPQGSDAASAPIGPLPDVERAINFQLPVVDIKPDGIGNRLEISYGTQLTVTYSINPRDFDRGSADWWLILCEPGICRSLNPDGSWTIFTGNNGTPMRTDLLENTLVAVYSGNALPVGEYTLYVGVDVIQDGNLTYNLLSFDSLTVNVR